MSSMFNQASQVGQPPAICRRRPPRGPFRFNWPPSEAQLYVSWVGPPGWASTARYDLVLQALYDPTYERYVVQNNPASPNLQLSLQFYPSPINSMLATVFIDFGPPLFAQALSYLQPAPPDHDITFSLPPWELYTPGHTFRLDFTAIYETIGNRIPS